MPFSCPTPIESAHFQIRLVEQSDIGGLLPINGDDALTYFLPYASWQTLEDGHAWFARVQGMVAAGGTLQFVIVERATKIIVGSCLLFRYDEASARAELGDVLARAQWGKGVMQEALTAVLNHAFTHCNLRRIEAEIDPRNIASNRLIAKLGFTKEGLFRGRWVNKGVVVDTNIYGLLRDEWRGAG